MMKQPAQTSLPKSLIRTAILKWGEQHGRDYFPWQAPHTPYKTWISEIMLQQTQAARVSVYFQRFIARWPSIEALAQADIDEIFNHWTGLGYYNRAANIYKTAQLVVEQYQGALPQNIDELCKLPGIGRSTAGAIRSLGFGLNAPILDGNVRRLLGRLNMISGKPASRAMEQAYWHLSEQLLPSDPNQHRLFNQTLMDLGALICTARQPKCTSCPLNKWCQAFHNDQVEAFPVTPSRYRKQQGQLKPPRRTERRFFLIAQHGEQILLEKRPNFGIWQGLWCPPEFTDQASLERFAKQLGLDPQRLIAQLCLRHVLSHFDLEIMPMVGQVTTIPKSVATAAQQQWYTLDSQSVGLPAPMLSLCQQVIYEKSVLSKI